MSKTYIVDVRVLLSREIRINAENEAEATNKALEMFNKGELKFSVTDDIADVYVPYLPTETENT